MAFSVDEFWKRCFAHDVDDICLTLEKEAKITAFEVQMAWDWPWR